MLKKRKYWSEKEKEQIMRKKPMLDVAFYF